MRVVVKATERRIGGTDMKRQYYIGISLFITIIILVLDQITKFIIASSMKVGDSFEVIPNFLNITSHRNDGAAWGILSGKMSFFFIITIIILVVLIVFYIKEAKNNLLIDTYIFGYNFPIFNVADSSLTIGVLLIIIALLTDMKKEE